VDEQEVEGVVSRGVHHVLLQHEGDSSNHQKTVFPCLVKSPPEGYPLGSSDFDVFLKIQYTSCVFGLALKS
jgi:hypothetical protein